MVPLVARAFRATMVTTMMVPAKATTRAVKALPVKIRVERIDDHGGQTVFHQVVENIAAVMSRSFEPYFYFAEITGRRLYLMQQRIESFHVIRDGENIMYNFSFRTAYEAVMLILGDVDSDINHGRYPLVYYFNAVCGPTGLFTSCNLVLTKPSLHLHLLRYLTN